MSESVWASSDYYGFLPQSKDLQDILKSSCVFGHNIFNKNCNNIKMALNIINLALLKLQNESDTEKVWLKISHILYSSNAQLQKFHINVTPQCSFCNYLETTV